MIADTITAIKKALEAAEQFIVNGVELGYIRMPDPETPDSAHQTLPMIRQAQTALESLQRENEGLRNLADRLKLEAQIHAMEARGANSTIAEIYQIISGACGEPGNLNGAEPVRKYVGALRHALKPFSKFAGVLFERNFNRTDSVAGMNDVDGVLHTISAGPFFDARAALSSTGDTHGN